MFLKMIKEEIELNKQLLTFIIALELLGQE
jgi:hypothetical protein